MNYLNITVVCSVLLACGTPRMVVPPEISKGADEVPATERSSMSGLLANESFKLGQYVIEDVDRDWNSSSSRKMFGFATDKTHGGYGYKVKGNGVTRIGGCTSEREEKTRSMPGFDMTKTASRIGCKCKSEDASVESQLFIAAGDDKKFSGELTTAAGTFRVTAIYDAQGTWSTGEPSGYRVDGDSPRGAVEVLRPGRIWFPHSMEESERAELTCLYAGLMLYVPPREK